MTTSSRSDLGQPSRFVAIARFSPLVIALACVAGTVRAQGDLAASPLDALLDVEVSGASKFALRMSESPSAVTVIGGDEIRALGHRTLGDVLRTVRGLAVSFDRTYTYLGVRGFSAPGDYNSRVLLLIDGVRINDAVYDQAYLGSEFPLDLDLVERVEFIPGHGSAVHGANALYAVINVVTRSTPADRVAETALRVATGGTRSLRLTGHASVARDARLMVSATGMRMRGTDAYYPEFDAPATHDGVSRDTDHEKNQSLYLKLAGTDYVASIVHADRRKGLTASPGTVFGDPRSLYRDVQTLADLSVQHRLDRLSRWKVRVYAGRYEYRGDYVVDYPPVTLNRDGVHSRWWGVEANVFTERFDAHRLVVGVDLQKSPRRDQTNADVDPPFSYLDDRRAAHRYSAYIEDQWTISPTMALTAGLRHDHAHGHDGEQSPRAALVWRARRDLVLKAIVGSAFRSPNAYEAHYDIPALGYKGSDTLRNERVRGGEAVVEYRPDPATRYTASAYANKATHLLVQDIDPAGGLLQFTNAGTLRARGVELEAERAWENGAHLRASIAMQKVRDDSGLGLQSHNPARLAKFAATWPLPRGATLGLQTQLISRRGAVPGGGVTHVNVAMPVFAPRGTLSFSVHDLFDRRPSDPGSDSVLQPTAPGDGRSFGLKLDLAF